MNKEQDVLYTSQGASMKAGYSDFGYSSRQQAWSPPTDVYETPQEIVVRVEIAGVKNDDFDIDFTDGVLSIRGNRTDVSPRRAFHRMEIPFGHFSINLKIAIPVNANRIEADYKDGFLLIRLPKAETRRIELSNE